jgi:hypothetical protein
MIILELFMREIRAKVGNMNRYTMYYVTIGAKIDD